MAMNYKNKKNKINNKERRILRFYKMTRCNWGGDTLFNEVSDEEYLKHIRNIRKEKIG